MSAKSRLGLSDLVEDFADVSFDQRQTGEAFGFKWSKRDTYESDAMKARAQKWLYERYCAGDAQQLDEWLDGGGKIILDAGCGSGFSALLFFGSRLRNNDYLGVDISNSVETAERRFAEEDVPGDFLRADISSLPIPNDAVDLIFSEGVLHHTDDTGASISSLAKKLKPGGLFLFYVYAKKGEIRELTDDYVRIHLAPLTDEEAWEALWPLSQLGKVIGELDVDIEVPADIPMLGIRAGRQNLQRFFYWNVLKTFYAPDLTLDEMNHINFDWFRPLNCHRHTPDEVTGFCQAADLEILRMDVQEAGITVVARRTMVDPEQVAATGDS